MTTPELIKELRNMLPEPVDYAELVCSPVPSSYGIHYVWNDPEPYIISNAADLLEEYVKNRYARRNHKYDWRHMKNKDQEFIKGKRLTNAESLAMLYPEPPDIPKEDLDKIINAFLYIEDGEAKSNVHIVKEEVYISSAHHQ